MTPQSREHGTLTLIIDDAELFFKSTHAVKWTDKTILCGFEWALCASWTTKYGVAWFKVGIICASVDQEDLLKCKATCIVRIRSSRTNDFTSKWCREFSDDDDYCSEGLLITIDNLFKRSSGYLKDNKITIVCNITVALPASCEADEGLRGMKRRCTDVKIVMGDRHVYANKGALAVQCGYFDAAFNGDFESAVKDELRLDDVDADDFAEFLKVVYRGAVNEHNVAAVAPLADRFQATRILQECESVLVNDLQLQAAIPILEKCGGLDDLKKQLLDGLSLRDLTKLTTADMLLHFSRETVVQLLNEAMRRLDEQRA